MGELEPGEKHRAISFAQIGEWLAELKAGEKAIQDSRTMVEGYILKRLPETPDETWIFDMVNNKLTYWLMLLKIKFQKEPHE